MKIFADGGARGNPGPAAIGFVVKDKKGKILTRVGKYLGKKTNNQAEYLAVIEALKWLKQNSQIAKFPNCRLDFYLDSQLIVNQLNGLYKIKDANLRNLIVQTRILEREVNCPVFYHLVSRRQNLLADRLVNQVLNQKGFRT